MNVPVCLFTYNRLEETHKSITSLQKNYLASETLLYIYSDGAKSNKEKEKVERVRDYLKTISGFKEVIISESRENKGLANSIIDGVTDVIQKHGRIIVLEDDLVTTSNFLDFMNQALNYYEKDPEILSISGFTLDLPSLPGNTDYYFGYRASSWGWGTWKEEWERVDWKMKDYKSSINSSSFRKKIRRGGSDMLKMLKSQKNGRIDSWAIRFCFHQSLYDLKTVFPTVSKLKSIGFSEEATHTVNTKRFDTHLDQTNQRVFKFEMFSNMNEVFVKEFRSKFSIKSRIIDKLRRLKTI